MAEDEEQQAETDGGLIEEDEAELFGFEYTEENLAQLLLEETLPLSWKAKADSHLRPFYNGKSCFFTLKKCCVSLTLVCYAQRILAQLSIAGVELQRK